MFFSDRFSHFSSSFFVCLQDGCETRYERLIVPRFFDMIYFDHSSSFLLKILFIHIALYRFKIFAHSHSSLLR